MSSVSSSFLPYGRQTVSEADIAAVVEVLRSSFLTQGPAVPAFEQAVAGKVGARHGVAVNSATSALHIACLALDLGPGDRLWTSPITFVASANCGRYCGAEVDFVDIDPDTGLMSVAALAAKLKQAECNGTLPKVVVPVHLAGSSCDLAAIAAMAERYGFAVLEDASHAIGGQFHGEPVGNCRYSDITVFSFHPVKIITTGEGGLATTNDPVLAMRMAELRSHGIVRDAGRFQQPAAGPWVYEQQQLGFNYRMTDIQAALGLSQLQRLDEIVAKRNRQLQRYRELLADLPAKLLQVPQDVLSAVHLAVIRLKRASTS
ncbi:MAG: UDP-4-amino-4,6-dideoxy-N-acetyl-beta-L-altrosamine transaminase, partial [Cyanobacteria bacterium K_DeepCast_35m_m2_023]|nr:UDP-4-amino-4,6-dideoxy-N-acetyl-beta-L-altrosamine transaminase [Cyanobacteria bacterium K_DeepCast_35m_m2_023]